LKFFEEEERSRVYILPVCPLGAVMSVENGNNHPPVALSPPTDR
jgi:hypothetical protein